MAELHGIMAEYEKPGDLVAAIHKVREAGFRNMDAYTPYPIEDVIEALEFKTKMPLLVLCAGIIGCLGGFGLQYWVSVIEYPMNYGGRPLNSWPAFIPITFECTILLCALTATFGMIAMNGLPMPYHPVFNVAAFREKAGTNGYFLCIEATDPKFSSAREALSGTNASEVNDVEA